MRSANRFTLALVLAASCVVGLLACSADSLWIDEAWVALIASENNLAGWWRRLQEIAGSTLQMPLYTFSLWAWEKLAGHGEWALRAANIPFFVLGQWALFRGIRRDERLALWTVGIAALSPFLWSYIAEARPYAMQYAAACLVVGGLMQLAKGFSFSGRDCVLFCLGLVMLCGTSSLAFPWAGMGLVSVLLLFRNNRSLVRLSRARLLLLAGTALGLLAVFLYDLWATRSGGRASSVGRTGGLNLLFSAYELLGFSGLGPARLAIRESQSLSILLPYFLPLSALGIALGLALFQVRQIEHPVARTILLYSVIPLIFVSTLAVFAPFRLLGRHLTPLAPVLVILLAYSAVKPTKLWLNRIFIVLWLISAVILRTDPRHKRDGYRDAAEIARESLARGESVWWSADPAGAEYYGLPLTPESSGLKSKAWLMSNRQDLESAGIPDVIISSKGDIFDSTGALSRYLQAHAFVSKETLPAFTVWRARD